MFRNCSEIVQKSFRNRSEIVQKSLGSHSAMVSSISKALESGIATGTGRLRSGRG
ncbi:MAG: hypothetical protein ACI9JE_001983, partial [Candidatus Krumholzibacteriia bacterium]